MAALPYMPLYVADYLADAAHLSTLEHGAYLILIMNYWQRGEALPDDDRKLARIARLSEDEWAAIREDIAEFFQIGDGVWRHKRVEQELNGVREKSDQAKRAGQASARARSKPSTTDDERPLNGGSTPAATPVQHQSNHTDTDTDTDRSNERSCAHARVSSVDFDLFWERWRAKVGNVGQTAARRTWAKLLDPDLDAVLAGVDRYVANKPPDRQWMAASRFLQDERWRDHAPNVIDAAAPRVFVELQSPQWIAWCEYRQTIGQNTPPSRDFEIAGRHRNGWHFPSEWPPGHGPPAEPEVTADENAAA
jgi:uncharacterized protein YdaU (DUF1376 family)